MFKFAKRVLKLSTEMLLPTEIADVAMKDLDRAEAEITRLNNMATSCDTLNTPYLDIVRLNKEVEGLNVELKERDELIEHLKEENEKLRKEIADLNPWCGVNASVLDENEKLKKENENLKRQNDGLWKIYRLLNKKNCPFM